MKILLVCSRIPYPLKDGGAIATFQMIEGIAALGHEVTVLSLNTKKHYVEQKVVDEVFIGLANVIQVPIDTTVKISRALRNLWSKNSYNMERFYSDEFSQKLKMEALTNKYDVIQFEGLFVANYIKDLEGFKGITSLRQHNVEHHIWEGLVKKERSLIKRAYLKLLAKRLKREEIALIPQFDTIVPISPVDAFFFKGYTEKEMHLCPIGVEWKGQKSLQNKKVYHIGSMEWLPNREGVLWFLEQVWPLVLLKEPDTQFYIAGKGLDVNDFKGHKQVEVMGEVASLEEFSKDKSILIVPLFSGSGVRVKILEAMALNKKVVSTAQGVQGLMYGHGISTAEKPEEFANLVVEQINSKVNPENENYLRENYLPKKLTNDLVHFYQSTLLNRK